MQADEPYSNVFTSSKGKELMVKSTSMQVEQSKNDKTFCVRLCRDCKAYFLWIRYCSQSVLYARFEKKVLRHGDIHPSAFKHSCARHGI